MDAKLFFAAQVSPLVYAATNLIDKTLLSKYFKEGGVVTLLIFSSIMSALVCPIAYAMDPSVFEMSLSHISIMAFVSLLNVVLLWAYLSALEQDDPSTVIVFYQLVPVLTLGVGYVLLHEVVSLKQGFAMIVIMIGTGIVSFDLRAGKRGFKWKTVGFMLIACACWASETVIFKVVALEDHMWPSLFWTSAAHAVVGVSLFVFSKKNRVSFIEKFHGHGQGKGIISLCVINESLYVIGNTVVYIVAMQTVVALVALCQTFQSVYVFLLEIAIAFLFPKFAGEIGGRGVYAQKILALTVCGVGTTLLFM